MAIDFGHIQERLQNPEENIKSKRAYELRPFVERINNSRQASGYRPYPVSYIAKMMAYIPTEEMHAFYKKLDQSKNFCALWHWYVKPKKTTSD